MITTQRYKVGIQKTTRKVSDSYVSEGKAHQYSAAISVR